MILEAGVLLVALGAAGAALARLGWPFEVAVSVAPQTAGAAVAIAFAAAAFGRLELSVVALLAGAAASYAARELFAPPAPPLERRDLRIVWANVFGRRAAFARVMALAAHERADLVLIAELPRGLSRADEARLAGAFSHRAGRPDLEGVWVAAFARAPIVDAEAIVWSPQLMRRGLVFTVATPAGGVRVTGVHPPVPFTPRMTGARDASIRAAFAVATEDVLPAVLVGDFNTTPWSPVLRAAASVGLVRVPPGARSTWLTPLPVLGLPIDHALVSRGVRASARVGPFVGSDHFPLIVDVAIGDHANARVPRDLGASAR
jgi:endonuclease/exonuclease/phosphatase (EEP) superfamily protein YafD